MSIRGEIDRAVMSLDVPAGVRWKLREMALTRLEIVRDYGGADRGMKALLRQEWASVDGELVGRWPSLGEVPSAGLLRHAARELDGGRVGVLLGRARGKALLRGSRGMTAEEAERIRTLLASWMYQYSNAPVSQVMRRMARQLESAGLPVPSRAWMYREARVIKADRAMQTMKMEGSRGGRLKGAYISVDKTTIAPGAQYVADHRPFDAIVIGSGGRLVRPWLTMVCDHRTLLPLGWSVLESPPNGDSVLVTLAIAMLPKVRNEYNGHLGDVLDSLCGVPDDCWIFDHGKDFSNSRIEGMGIDESGRLKRLDRKELASARAMLTGTHVELGTEYSSEGDLIFGLAEETGARVRRSIPYNGRSKIVERMFRDVSWGFDVFVSPGYVGNEPAKRPQATVDARSKYLKLFRHGFTRSELSEATGLLLLEDFQTQFEAWLWEWAAREHSDAQGLELGGRRYSPLAMWEKAAPRRRVPGRETLERLSLSPATRRIDRGRVQIASRTYYHEELVLHDGGRCVLRYSPLRPEEICLEGIVGGRTFSPALWAKEVVRVPANATREELEAAMSAQARANRRSAARVRELTREDVPDVLGDLVAACRGRGVETGRGQITGAPGASFMEVVDLRDVKRERRVGVAARSGALSAPLSLDVEDAPVVEEGGKRIFASRWEREAWERAHAAEG